VKIWIRDVCDIHVYDPTEDPDEMIFWRKWQAPSFIVMEPSKFRRFDPAKVWERNDAAVSSDWPIGSRRTTRFASSRGSTRLQAIWRLSGRRNVVPLRRFQRVPDQRGRRRLSPPTNCRELHPRDGSPVNSPRKRDTANGRRNGIRRVINSLQSKHHLPQTESGKGFDLTRIASALIAMDLKGGCSVIVGEVRHPGQALLLSSGLLKALERQGELPR
jgi:hypothetical protein